MTRKARQNAGNGLQALSGFGCAGTTGLILIGVASFAVTGPLALIVVALLCCAYPVWPLIWLVGRQIKPGEDLKPVDSTQKPVPLKWRLPYDP